MPTATDKSNETLIGVEWETMHGEPEQAATAAADRKIAVSITARRSVLYRQTVRLTPEQLEQLNNGKDSDVVGVGGLLDQILDPSQPLYRDDFEPRFKLRVVDESTAG